MGYCRWYNKALANSPPAYLCLMRRILEIIGSSLNLTLQEFRSHKLRTLLSLSGVAFGIFCILLSYEYLFTNVVDN